jgi:hypothetical protein
MWRRGSWGSCESCERSWDCSREMRPFRLPLARARHPERAHVPLPRAPAKLQTTQNKVYDCHHCYNCYITVTATIIKKGI